MNLYDNLLQQTIYYSRPLHSQREADNCTPWENDIRETPFCRSYDYSLNNRQPSKRYSSQLNNCKRRSQDRNRNSHRKHSFLTEKAVSIEYENTKTDIAQQHINKIKLPTLTSKNIHSRLIPSKREEHHQIWECLYQNNRKSLKKYTQKNYSQQSQQFQLYKRNVIAARKSILNSLVNPQRMLELYGKI